MKQGARTSVAGFLTYKPEEMTVATIQHDPTPTTFPTCECGLSMRFIDAAGANFHRTYHAILANPNNRPEVTQ